MRIWQKAYRCNLCGYLFPLWALEDFCKKCGTIHPPLDLVLWRPKLFWGEEIREITPRKSCECHLPAGTVCKLDNDGKIICPKCGKPVKQIEMKGD